MGPSIRICGRNADECYKSTAAVDARTSPSRSRHLIRPKPRRGPCALGTTTNISGVLPTRRVALRTRSMDQDVRKIMSRTFANIYIESCDGVIYSHREVRSIIVTFQQAPTADKDYGPGRPNLTNWNGKKMGLCVDGQFKAFVSRFRPLRLRLSVRIRIRLDFPHHQESWCA